MKNLIIFIISFIVLLATSCESIIEPDLRDATPQLVIEGIITNEDTTHVVLLSMSTSFTAESQFIGVDGATIELTDETDNSTQILTMEKTGVYTTTKFAGISGHSYFLRVNVNNDEYTARSIMPNHVPVADITQNVLTIGNQSAIYLQTTVNDPADEENYYKSKVYYNSTPKKSLNIGSDDRKNGLPISRVYFVDENLASTDTVDIYFSNIDKNVYTYFDSLKETLDANSVAPANPISNINGGCLGYFSAQTIERRRIIIE
jgi:hypothetical protein